MDRIVNTSCRLLLDDEGQDIIEYGLLGAFVSIALVTVVFGFSTPLNAIYERVLAGLSLLPS